MQIFVEHFDVALSCSTMSISCVDSQTNNLSSISIPLGTFLQPLALAHSTFSWFELSSSVFWSSELVDRLCKQYVKFLASLSWVFCFSWTDKSQTRSLARLVRFLSPVCRKIKAFTASKPNSSRLGAFSPFSTCNWHLSAFDIFVFFFGAILNSWIPDVVHTVRFVTLMCHSMACLATSKQNRTVRKQRSKMCLQTRRSAEIMSKWRQEPRWQLLWQIYLNLLRSEALHRLLMYREGFATTKFCFQKKSKGLFLRNFCKYDSFASIYRRNLCLGDQRKAKDVKFQLCKVLLHYFSHNFGVINI